MAALMLDTEVIRSLIDRRFGGSIARLAASLSLEPSPDRSTVARWLSSEGKHFPRDEERILALAGALDLDPTALWTFDEENFPTVWPRIVQASRTGRWNGLLKALAFLQLFTEPADEWPAQALARRYYDRPWNVVEFVHDPRREANFYQGLIIRQEKTTGPSPVVFHLAWRHGGYAAKWQPFGFVRRDPHRVMLFNEWAITESAPTTPASTDLCVQTWLGRGASAFRVASLHPFTLTMTRAPVDGIPRVRFAIPGEPDALPSAPARAVDPLVLAR